MVKLLELTKDIEEQAEIYEITFNLQKATTLSKFSPKQVIKHQSKAGITYFLYPILEVCYSKRKNLGIVILPHNRCCILGEKEIQPAWTGYSQEENGMFSKMNVGNYLITIQKYTDLEIQALILETSKPKVIRLMRLLEKISQSNYNKRINFSYLEEGTISLKALIEKERDDSIEKITESFENQLSQLAKAKKLEEVKFSYPSPNVLKVTLKTTGHFFSFEYSLEINPSLGVQQNPDKTEDAHFWLQALETGWESNPTYAKQLKILKIRDGIEHLMRSKKWFNFGVDNNIFKVTKKYSNSGDRFYVNGVMTKKDIVSRFLLELQTKSKKEILDKLENLHKIPAEIRSFLTNGIKGRIVDLEGEIKFHIGIKRRKNRYSFIIKGTEFNMKGGLIELKKFRNAVEGNARRSKIWNTLGIQYSRDYRYIIYLLKKLLGKKEAIVFFKLVKKESKRLDAMSSEKLKQYLMNHTNQITKQEGSILEISVNGRLFLAEGCHTINEIKGDKRFPLILEVDESKREEESLIESLNNILNNKIKVSSYGYSYQK